MTASIINLRKARKAKARGEAVKKAGENRVKFGRTKAERAQVSAVIKIETQRLDGANRAAHAGETGDDGEPKPGKAP